MDRVPEPELMDSLEQAHAYASADWEEAHAQHIERFREVFPGLDPSLVLDIGCGPGDITIRLARLLPHSTFVAIDGASPMLELGRRDARQAGLADRIHFVESMVPGSGVPPGKYDLIVSTSFLHHLHNPMGLWETIAQHGTNGTAVFVIDLYRPETLSAARNLVDTYAEGEPEILQHDFYHSFLAAFTPGEIEAQLKQAGLLQLKVETLNDRHVMIHGTLT